MRLPERYDVSLRGNEAVLPGLRVCVCVCVYNYVCVCVCVCVCA